ncbi:MAG: class I SAM-dependent methyltransferase [Bacteroidales bacterium]|nr:class I SAM-dependent methyltransferase [Bacteroidales bacterium]
MQYDPIKRRLGVVFNQSPFLRKTFYRLLDLLLLRAWHVKKELRQWKKDNPGKADVLDAGSGFGQYDFFLGSLNQDWQVHAVDVKEEQVEDNRRFFTKIGYNNVHFELGDLTKYVRENAFDLIISVDVMEHILEDVKVFENFYKSLKPGGMVLISTPSDQGGSDVHDHGHESFIEEHVRDGYNIDEIQDKLKKGGFEKTFARYQYGNPGKISWRLSMKYPLLMLNRSKLFFILLPFYYLFTYPVSYLLNKRDVKGNHSSGTGLIVKAWKKV